MKKCAILFVACISLLASAAVAAEPEVSLLETNVLRVRVNLLTDNFAELLRAATPTNAVIGNILDLRSAHGDNVVSVSANDYFFTPATPLVILVGAQTSGAAVALAKNLRATGSGLVIGSANGKIQPDITVTVRASDEKIFLDNPFAVTVTNQPGLLSATNDLLPYVDHTSEADLVRKRIKDGDDSGDPLSTPRAEPTQPIIHDPVLARAVDLIKALAVLHPAHG